MAVTETIRKELQSRSETLYRVSKDTGIAWSTLRRFVGGSGIHSDHFDTLAQYLELELVPATGSPPAPKGKRK